MEPEPKKRKEIRNGIDFLELLNQRLAELGSSVRVTAAEPESRPAEDGTTEIVAVIRPLSRRQEPPEEAAEED